MSSTQKKGRNTKQLEVIWHAIKDDKSHPTAEQIYKRVRRELPNISLNTVYRNLQKLVATEKLQILILGRSQHFDPLVSRHQHFICEACDRVFDVFLDTPRKIQPAKLPEEGFKVTSHQLAFYGTCRNCSA
jgi:Fur family peroxide stress response transcriptional regulator